MRNGSRHSSGKLINWARYLAEWLRFHWPLLVIGSLLAALGWITGCSPRYRADDPSIWSRPEVLETVKDKT